ncbi:hypothetical protein [Burkholderia phage FLC8]|nr:hypothetical protein [Burkholderia phage FLC8]
MQLTNSDLLRDAINSYKEDLVVIMNERAGYVVKYNHFSGSRVQQEQGLSRVQIDRSIIDLQQLIRAGGNLLDNLDTYIKAGFALIKWIDGQYTGVQLPQMQLLVAPAVEAILSGVGKGASQLDKNESAYVTLRVWANLYEVSQTLMLQP